MKKTIGIMVFMTVLLFSCNKDKKTQDNVSKTSQNIYASQNLYEAVHNGDIVYIQKYIEEPRSYAFWGNWVVVTNNDLRLLRNTIYAMHGYMFKSNDLQEHFKKFKWYKGTKENVDNELNEKEKNIVRIVSATEKINPPVSKDLVGRWIMPVPASVENIGFLDYWLEPDGRIEGHNVYGRWSLEGTTFRIISDDEGEYWPLNGGVEIKNFRIDFVEYEGELYKECCFFETGVGALYEADIPREYWSY